jgi:flagellar biogenesis protein FliO
MSSLLRLLWALPLVLAIGAGAMLVLRRFVLPVSRAHAAQRLVFREQLALSEQTRVHLLEIDGNGYLLVESTQNATLQPLPAQTREVARRPGRSRPAWLRHFSGVAG